MHASDLRPGMLGRALKLHLSQPTIAPVGSSQNTGFFNHDTLLALTAGGSLAWEPNLLALWLWDIFSVLGIPHYEGTAAAWSRAEISTPGAVHSGRRSWQG